MLIDQFRPESFNSHNLIVAKLAKKYGCNKRAINNILNKAFNITKKKHSNSLLRIKGIALISRTTIRANKKTIGDIFIK